MNLFTKQKQTLTDMENKLMVNKGQAGVRGGGGINQEYRINRYTLPYIKQINNKDLLFSTGNRIQYLVITYNGKELNTKNICYIYNIILCNYKYYIYNIIIYSL